MKKNIKKSIYLFLCLSFVLVNDIQAETIKKPKEYTEVIKKDFSIKKTGKVILNNKFGNIDVKTWDKGKVKITATIVVDASSKGSAEEIFKTIDVNFRSTNDELEVETERETNRKWWQWSRSSSETFRVHYEVTMPKTGHLSLDNKYGDVFIEDIEGRSNITLNHGNLKMNKISATTSIFLNYANATIEKANDLNVTLRHGKFELEEVRDLKINSRYSRIYIEKAGDLNTNTKNDKYYIGEMRNLKNDGKYDSFEIETANGVFSEHKYSDFTIETLKSEGEFISEFGDIVIEKLDNNFNKIKFTGENADLNLNLSGSSTIELYSKYTTVKLPKNLKAKIKDESSMEQEIHGRIGNNPKGSIKINTEHGSVIIKK